MKSLKLNQIEKETLSNQELSQIKGGNSCRCACYYRNVGGSSIADNGTANWREGRNSVHYTNDEAIMLSDGEGGCYNFWER